MVVRVRPGHGVRIERASRVSLVGVAATGEVLLLVQPLGPPADTEPAAAADWPLVQVGPAAEYSMQWRAEAPR